ncbi:MAG: DUF4199 domain-containing protein [Pseudomonadota bacterium]
MLKIALVYGAISGIVVISIMTLGMSLGSEGQADFAGSQVFGYLVMLVALMMIFIGVKRYRDQSLGGVIKFGPALGLGLAIAAVAGVFYVIGWEIFLAVTDYAFINDYRDSLIATKEKAGVTGAELEKVVSDMTAMMENYRNPLFRIPITFLEIFPVGIVIALVSAAILRNPKAFPARG